jgi:hypothetical protein
MSLGHFCGGVHSNYSQIGGSHAARESWAISTAEHNGSQVSDHSGRGPKVVIVVVA